MRKRIYLKKGFSKWWALSLAIVVVIEVGVCLLLFIPQNKALAEVAKRRGALENQKAEAAQITSTLGKIRKEADEVDQRLQEAKLFTQDRAEVAILNGVANANRPAVMFLSLTPVKPPDKGGKPSDPNAPVAPMGLWLLRIKGLFPDFVPFLSKLEQEGILLDSANFEADGVKQRGIVEVSAAVKVCSPEDVARILAEAQKASALAAAKNPQ